MESSDCPRSFCSRSLTVMTYNSHGSGGTSTLRRRRNVTSERIIAHVHFAPASDGGGSFNRYILNGTDYYVVCVDGGEGESDTTNKCSGGVAGAASRLTASRTCIVGYVLTPLDKCVHSVPGKFPVIYGEVDAFDSGLGFIYHHFSRLETMNRSVSGIGSGNRQTTRPHNQLGGRKIGL